MHSIQQQIDILRERISRAAEQSGRTSAAVTLLAVSKTRSSAEIRAAHAGGLRNFGENYLQEALPKIRALSDLDLCWHFIGAVQSNKTRDICQHFQWVHTLDREKIARRLSRQRQEFAPQQPLNVCIQINIDREPQKAGIAPTELPALLTQLADCDGIRLRGLMAIPEAGSNPVKRRESFRNMHQLFEQSRNLAGDDWDTLSMGMSADFEDAILEGATIIRLGTALFGPRPSNHR